MIPAPADNHSTKNGNDVTPGRPAGFSQAEVIA